MFEINNVSKSLLSNAMATDKLNMIPKFHFVFELLPFIRYKAI